MSLWLSCLGLMAALLTSARGAAQPAAAAVYVIAVANAESFDRDLPVLRYAHEDLARFARVMTATGLVPDDHILRVTEGKRGQVRAAFAEAARRMGDTGGKFIFYYTGHSDANGLHLADGVLGKSELHALIAAVPAAARIAFFDGCYSGALAAKGVKPAGDFVVPKAEFDQPSGSVFFAATSGTDVAFEVEELQGSLFSHHLVDGLYGAADGNHDGLVTIDELYQHVYKQMAGYAAALPAARAQKPEYRVDLQGRGALVLSYLTKSTAPVAVGSALVGELTFASADGLQVYRVGKRAKTPLRLLLVPGDYAVTVRDGDLVGRAALAVRATGGAALEPEDFVFHTEHNLDLVAKGKRPEVRWAVAVGTIRSSYTRIGPSVELQTATPSVRIESSDWRLVAYAGGRKNALYYRDQTGTSETVSLVVGAGGSFTKWGFFEGQQWRLLVGGGADYAWQHWSAAAGAGGRTFERLSPKAAAGLGTAFTLDSGLAWGLSFRREFPFAKERGTGDVLAFGASLVALSVEW